MNKFGMTHYTVCKATSDGFACVNHYYGWFWFVFAVLAVLVLLCVGLMVWDQYSEYKAEKNAKHRRDDFNG